MKLETFFQKFDLFAEAPNAIPSMRELVLQLAVRGNLTERIDGEASEPQLDLAKAFRIRRGKRGEPDAEDIPFSIPRNWGWVAVGDSMNMINGRAFKPEEWSAEGTPIIRIQNLNNEGAAFNRCIADLDPKIQVHDGDFLISWSGTPGTSFGAFIWKRGFAYLNQHIFRCELVEGVFVKEFLRLAINARLDEMISHAQGAVGLRHITKGKLESIRLPLPPLAEQKRIVAKVDELMALCDRLEAQQHERETRHAALARASLAHFADGPSPANLNYIFHPSYAISPTELRKAILTLAIQGKLIPQRLSEDTEEQRRSAKEAKCAAKGASNGVWTSDNAIDEPFAIPANWSWICIGDAIDMINGRAFKASEWSASGLPIVRIQNLNNEAATFNYYEGDFDPRHKIENGSFLISWSGTPGTSFGAFIWNRGDALLNQHIFKCGFFGNAFEAAYLALSINARLDEMISHAQGGVGLRHITKGKLESIGIPLPPLAEQRRIVAKVDQLMALVDQMETQLAASRTTAANLLSALVAELTTTGAKQTNSKSNVPIEVAPRRLRAELTSIG